VFPREFVTDKDKDKKTDMLILNLPFVFDWRMIKVGSAMKMFKSIIAIYY